MPDVIVKKSSGCLPYSLGCLSGILFTLISLTVALAVLLYFGDTLFGHELTRLYRERLRPEMIESLPLDPQTKQLWLNDFDQFIHNFDQLSLEQKKQKVKELAKPFQKISLDDSLSVEQWEKIKKGLGEGSVLEESDMGE